MKTPSNLWPLGIMAAFGIFISGTATLVVIACTHRTDLITPNYYEDEIKFQSRIDQLNRTARLGGEVVVAYDDTNHCIRILLPSVRSRGGISGRIQLYRPSATGLDREIKLEPDATGSQSLDATSLLPGLWKVRVHWSVQNQDYFADRNVVVKRSR